MPTRKVPAVQKSTTEWRGPALLVSGALLGIAATSAFLLPRVHPVQPNETVLNAPPSAHPTTRGAPVRGGRGKLTHPLLTCSAEPSEATDLADLNRSIAAILDVGKHEGVTRAAVHVTDLETCRWFEIGGTERFSPASMMKLPLALAWMRRASKDASVLEQALVYTLPPNADTREDMTLPIALKTGERYPVRELLRRMLVESRNDAKWLLMRDMPPTELALVWSELDLTPPQIDAEPQVTVHDMSMMFHALYDGAWLGRDGSERTLAWLSDATYKDGLLADLPSGAVVAHKFGRRVRANAPAGEWNLQLHDCGILYRAGRPVLACVMTEGNNEAAQQRVMQRVATQLWTYAQAPL